MTVTRKTYNDYIESLKNSPQCVFYPQWDKIKEPFKRKPEKYIGFALWILHTAAPPQTEEEKECVEHLNSFVDLFLTVVN